MNNSNSSNNGLILNNSNRIENLFLKCWKNNYIKSTILYYCRLFRLHNSSGHIIISSIPSLNYALSYKYFEFCKSFSVKNSSYLSKLPKDISQLRIRDTIYIKSLHQDSLDEIVEYFRDSPITSLEISINYIESKSSSIQINNSNKNKYLKLEENKKSLKLQNQIIESLPTNLQSLVLDITHSTIESNFLKPGLKKLTLTGNCTIKDGSIPSSVEDLSLYHINQELSEHMLPSSLKILNLGNTYNEEFSNDTFKNCQQLKYIRFGTMFNKSINPGVLPNSLEEIQFSCDSFYNIQFKLGSLPNGLKKLTLPSRFNQPLLIKNSNRSINSNTSSNNNENKLKRLFKRLFKKEQQPKQDIEDEQLKDYISILPSTLEYLSFGYGFKQSIYRGSIPLSVKELHFNSSTTPIFQLNSIPNVKILTLPRDFHSLDNSIENNGKLFYPEGLEELRIPRLSPTARQLVISNSLKIPTSVKRLSFLIITDFTDLNDIFYQDQNYQFDLIELKGHKLSPNFTFDLHYNIKQLKLDYRLYENINSITLPSNIENLVISGGHQNSINTNFLSNLSDTLKHLEITCIINDSSTPLNFLPSSLESLKLGDVRSVYNLSFLKSTGPKFKSLSINNIYNATAEQLKAIISPLSITNLEIIDHIPCQVDSSWLPKNIKSLLFSSNTNTVAMNNLPQSLEYIGHKHIDFLIYQQKTLNSLNSLEIFQK